jgi:hypothetical protein
MTDRSVTQASSHQCVAKGDAIHDLTRRQLVIPIVLLVFLCVGFVLLNQVRLRTVRAEKQKIDDVRSDQ